jgi:FkbM family methyltransferase
MIKQGKILVQIGTNNGNDAFNKIVRYANPTKVILVEPNAKLNNKIRENYKGIDIILENVIISNDNNARLVHPKNKYSKSGKRIGKLNYSDVHYSLLPMDDWGNDFDIINSPCISFMALCEKYSLEHIHYLQIDTEGYDAEIIKSIDFNKVKIDMIEYERWNFPENRFTRHGDKAKLYGVNGMRAVSNLLDKLGYIQISQDENILAIWYG